MARTKTPGLKKFNIYLPENVMKSIDYLANKRSSTRAELVRGALRAYAMAELLKERETKDLEDLVDDQYADPEPKSFVQTTPPSERPTATMKVSDEPIRSADGAGRSANAAIRIGE